jgi:hypothetical protein
MKSHRRSGMFGAKMKTLLLAAMLLAGCAKPAAYREPIVRYQLASAVVIENARIEYADANDRERAAVVARAVERRQRMDLVQLSSDEVKVLDGAGIAARMSALNALAKHGQLLLALASSDAPERSRAAANDLGGAIADLQSALTSAPSDEFKNKATGFAAIAGEIIRLALEKRISEALDRAILASEGDVDALIGLIRRDMGLLYERRKSILSAERVAAIDDFNDEVGRVQVDREALRKAANRVLWVEEEWDQLALLQGAAPSLDAMSQAHRTLVAYAKGPKSPQDLADLIEAIESFVARVSIVADAIKRIRSE